MLEGRIGDRGADRRIGHRVDRGVWVARLARPGERRRKSAPRITAVRGIRIRMKAKRGKTKGMAPVRTAMIMSGKTVGMNPKSIKPRKIKFQDQNKP